MNAHEGEIARGAAVREADQSARQAARRQGPRYEPVAKRARPLREAARARMIPAAPNMDRPSSTLLRALALPLVSLACVQLLACSGVTTVTPEDPIQIQAKPPAPPLADLPPVAQPPPPPRVTLEDEVLVLDETLTADADGQLGSEHDDILDEVAAWLDQHGEVTELSVEAYSVGPGNKRAHRKRSAALAEAIVAALVARGVGPERLRAVGAGKSDHDHVHIVLRVSARAE